VSAFNFNPSAHLLPHMHACMHACLPNQWRAPRPLADGGNGLRHRARVGAWFPFAPFRVDPNDGDTTQYSVTQIDREWTFGSLAYAAHPPACMYYIVRSRACVRIGRVSPTRPNHNGRSQRSGANFERSTELGTRRRRSGGRRHNCRRTQRGYGVKTYRRHEQSSA
jgi:hypothetical protein